MHNNIYRKTSGGALVTTMVLTGIVAILAAAVLPLVVQEYRFTIYSSAWSQALHAAEAGVEEGLYELHEDLFHMTAFSSWNNTGGGVYERAMAPLSPAGQPTPVSAPEFSVTVNTNTFTITAVGEASAAKMTDEFERTVQVVVEPVIWWPFTHAILGKDMIHLSGNSMIDSFKSDDPTMSTGGEYDAALAQMNADVGSTAYSTGAIIVTIEATGNGELNGDFHTGAGATADIQGSFDHNGDVYDDLDIVIPDTTIPISTAITHPNISGADTITVSGTVHMAVEEMSLGGNQTLTIEGEGKIIIYVEDTLQFTGASSLVMTPNPPGSKLQVEIYSNAEDTLFNSAINNGGNAADFGIWGTTNVSSLKFTGPDDYVGTIYAPEAYVHITGNGDIYGSVLGHSIDYQSGSKFHYDEALATNKSPVISHYNMISWTEL